MEQVRATTDGASEPATCPTGPRRSLGFRRPRVIVFDAGPAAWVAVHRMTGTVEIGTRLTFRGSSWQVIAYRPHARAWVAEPVLS